MPTSYTHDLKKKTTSNMKKTSKIKTTYNKMTSNMKVLKLKDDLKTSNVNLKSSTL